MSELIGSRQTAPSVGSNGGERKTRLLKWLHEAVAGSTPASSTRHEITILENKIAEYKKQKEQELFFDETTDPIISKLRCKIESQKSKQQEYEMSIKNKLKQINHEL